MCSACSLVVAFEKIPDDLCGMEVLERIIIRELVREVHRGDRVLPAFQGVKNDFLITSR